MSWLEKQALICWYQPTMISLSGWLRLRMEEKLESWYSGLVLVGLARVTCQLMWTGLVQQLHRSPQYPQGSLADSWGNSLSSNHHQRSKNISNKTIWAWGVWSVETTEWWWRLEWLPDIGFKQRGEISRGLTGRLVLNNGWLLFHLFSAEAL